jgi:hypothetical protein
MKSLFTFALLAAFVAPMLGCHAEGDVGDSDNTSKTTTVKTSSDGSYQKKTTVEQSPSGSYQRTETRTNPNP